MELRFFSISLTVKDLHASKACYEKLGFVQAGDTEEHGYFMMSNGGATLGLYAGMFERNILTFNPLEGQHADVREIRAFLAENGIDTPLLSEMNSADPADANPTDSTSGPAHLVIHDPDGNPILIDQFH